MGLLNGLNTWAIKRMAKENFEETWPYGYGCEGTPSRAAVQAIEDVAETASRYVNYVDKAAAEIALSQKLQRLAQALNGNDFQIALASGVLIVLFQQLTGYEWAALYVDHWSLNELWK